MAVEVRNVLQKCLRMVQSNVIEQYQMLVNLPHVTNVRNNRNFILPRQHAYRKKLTDSTHTGAIWLYETNAARFKIVLENDAIRNMLSYSNG